MELSSRTSEQQVVTECVLQSERQLLEEAQHNRKDAMFRAGTHVDSFRN
jgi:hypothetical protein